MSCKPCSVGHRISPEMWWHLILLASVFHVLILSISAPSLLAFYPSGHSCLQCSMGFLQLSWDLEQPNFCCGLEQVQLNGMQWAQAGVAEALVC